MGPLIALARGGRSSHRSSTPCDHSMCFIIYITSTVALLLAKSSPTTATTINGNNYKGYYTNSIRTALVTTPTLLTTASPNSPLHINVTLPHTGAEHTLVLHPSTDRFLAKHAILEYHRKNRRERRAVGGGKDLRLGVKECHYHGWVHGQEGRSSVAVSTCRGMNGFIHTEEERYLIEPIHHDLSAEINVEHPHLVYKRSAVLNNTKRKKRKRKHHSRNCGTREPKRLTELEWKTEFGKFNVQAKRNKANRLRNATFSYHEKPHKRKHKKFKKPNRNTRSISKPRYVEALLVADNTMVDFHGEEEEVEMYLLTIMNMVSLLYLDPSIGNLIRITVVKIVLVEDPHAQPPLNVTTNADVTLRNFCRWQRALNPGNDSHPHHHDVAILLTRQDICARHDTPCNTLGVAHVGGMCNRDRSCSVNEDNGITLAHTIAHEMGHNFGMYHDTDKIGCKGKEGNRLHIMTPSFEADTVEVTWSRCSRRDLTNFLDKGMGECLQDEPNIDEEYSYPSLPPGAMYDAERQCRLQFGADTQVCTPPNEICSRLWCLVNGTCTTQLRPAAPGTRCGVHKWCQDHKCVPMMEPPLAIDGGWGDWSSWTPCSRSCGAGVSMMTRDCDHPSPKAGGRFCVGERRRYKICNTDACPADEPSFRAVQCSRYNNETYEGKKWTWLSYFDSNEPCELYCTDANDTVIVPWGEHATDGTSCNVGTRDVCISGICRKVGCDWQVDSKANEDICGVCEGDGSTCDTIRGVYTKQGLGAAYREMIYIPAWSRNILLQEKDYAENYISIGSGTTKRFYLNGKRHITIPGEYIVAGTQALYDRDNDMEKILIPGPIRESIIVYVVFKGKAYNPGITYQYTIAKRVSANQVRYIWKLDDWSQCSSTCGGGVQQRIVLCMEVPLAISTGSNNSTNTTIVSKTLLNGMSTVVDEAVCPQDKKPDKMMRACNEENCPSNWWIGPWQSCSVTCASKGTKPHRRRSVMCVDGQEMALPDRYCDIATRPNEHQPCKPLPDCIEQ